MLDCILLAAGGSTRMGAMGGVAASKPLLPFTPAGAGDLPTGKLTLVETAARAALGAGCRVLIVLGHRGEEVASLFEKPYYAALRGSGLLVFAHNPRWEEGMVGSIQAALELTSGDAFFVAHADMPFVESADYLALAAARAGAAARPGWGETAFFASHDGESGHPVLMPSAWITAIAAIGPGEKLRPFLADRPSILVETGERALRDIDTPSDYQAAIAACKGPKTM
jgi:molybdenum cofactor cytidylyltransferase